MSGAPKGWNGDLATLTDDELAAYGKHCLRIGVHPTSAIMRAVLAEMHHRKPAFFEEYAKSAKVTVIVEPKRG